MTTGNNHINPEPQLEKKRGLVISTYSIIIVTVFLVYTLFYFVHVKSLGRGFLCCIYPKHQHLLEECNKNLEEIAFALDIYAIDNIGRFPADITKLKPYYIKEFPKCPVAGKDTYSASYEFRAGPDAFTIYCSGNNHPNMNKGPNYPKYTSIVGCYPKP